MNSSRTRDARQVVASIVQNRNLLPHSHTRALSSSQSIPYVALAFGILAMGMSAIFVKWANAPGAVSGFYRMAIATGIMVLPFTVDLQRHPLFVSRHPPRVTRQTLYAILAGLFFAGDLATWNTAVLIGNAANATLFGNTAPIWVSLGALFFFKEKLPRSFWAGLLLAMLGAAVVLGGDFLTHPAIGAGDLLGLVAGVFYGLFLLATERARDRLSSLVSWWISAAVCSVALLAISLILEQPLTGYSLNTYLNLVGIALVTQVGGWLAINYALGHLRASLVAPTLLMQPVLVALLGVPLLNQPLTLLQGIGGAIVLAGIMLVHKKV